MDIVSTEHIVHLHKARLAGQDGFFSKVTQLELCFKKTTPGSKTARKTKDNIMCSIYSTCGKSNE